MSSKFVLNSKASKAAVQKAEAKGGRKRYKMEGEKAELLILPPVKEDEAFFGTNIVHQHFREKQFICKSASPSAFEQNDKLIKIGWALKDKFDPKDKSKKKHPNIKVKDFWKSWMPSKQTTVYVLDLKNLEAGAQLWDIPAAVKEVIFDEVNENDGDLTTICDLKEGRKLLIRKKGAGMQTKYGAKFSNNLAAPELTDEQEEAIIKTISSGPLSRIQEPLNEAEFEKVYNYLAKKAEALKIDLDAISNDDDSNDILDDDSGGELDDDGTGDVNENEIEDPDDGELSDDDVLGD